MIFVLEGLVPIFTGTSEMAKTAIVHLGYPVYFIILLTVFKGLGGFALILPMIPKNVKEWAYAGYSIDFISAFVSICVVDGFGIGAILPVVAMLILVVSYKYYHRLHRPVSNTQ